MVSSLLPIGEVARMAGVSVQTLRHYDKLGLIRPTEVSGAGYRLYSQADCARLELLRTLRGLGFDLDTIAGLLKGEQSPAGAVRLQLEALDLQVRTLKRQQTVLRAVLRGEAGAILSRLNRMQALAGLDRLEREAFLAAHLKEGMGGQTGDPGVWKAAALDLPEDLDEGQLEAWLELAEIAASEEFQATLRRQMRPPEGLDAAAWEAWGRGLQGLVGLAVRAVREGRPPRGEGAAEALREGLGPLARLRGRADDAALAGWLLGYLESAQSPQMNRYWELVARLKGWEYDPVYGQASAWLIDGLRWLSQTGPILKS